ncbi:MAG TPA: DMT family transporter [Nitrospiria bacterium]|nr:DMT family transporter [Nitrospiria bacterium]
MFKTRRERAELYLFATTFIWGGTFVAVKLGLGDLSPVLFVTLRFSLAALVLLSLSFNRLLAIDRALLWKGSFLGALLFLGFVLQTVGLTDTTASKSAFITGLMVIFTPFFQIAIEKRAPKFANFAGVAIVTAGLWFLTSPSEGGPSGTGFTRGDGLTLLCAAVFGLYIVMLDLFSKDAEALPLTFLQMLTPAVLGWIILPLIETPVWNPTPNAIAVLLFCSLLGNVLSNYVQTLYQRDTTPTRAVIIFTIEPLWASILGYWMLQEVIGYGGVAGGAMIIAGILVSELSDSASSPPASK